MAAYQKRFPTDDTPIGSADVIDAAFQNCNHTLAAQVLKSVTHSQVVLLAVPDELDSKDALVRQTAHLLGHEPSDGLIHFLCLGGILGSRDEEFHLDGILSCKQWNQFTF